MNQKLLEQIALAKQTGSNAMAKDFFAKTPGIEAGQGDDAPPVGKPGDGSVDTDVPSPAPGKPGILGDVPTDNDTSNSPDANATKLTPEMLQELLALIKQQGGGGAPGQGQ